MEKTDVAASRQASPAALNAPRRFPFWRCYWDFLAVILLVIGSFPTTWITQRTVTLVPNLGLIDDNWHLDYTFKALRHIWIGRDVAFTHGPMFQWLSSIPARSLPLTVGALYATWNTVPIWCGFLFAYLALRLLLPEQPSWKRFVLLLMLASFWETSLRTTYPVLAFALFLRGWYAVQAGLQRGRGLRGVYAGAASAIVVVLGFLIGGDTGIYTVAAWVICFVAMAYEMRHQHFTRSLVAVLASSLVGFGVFAVVVNAFTALPFDFKFWRETMAQISVYRWATPAAMTDQGATHLCGALLIAALVFGYRVLTRRRNSLMITERTGFLLASFLFGLAGMQSSLVRSDIGHVIIGEFAMTFFVSAILFSFDGAASLLGVFVAVGASMMFSHPIFRPSSVLRIYGELRHPMTSCPPGYNEFQQACYVEPLTPQMLAAGGSFLQQHSGARDWTFIFPYQTMFGLAAQRNVAGGLMQPYTASGPELVRIEMAGLEGKSIPAALYMPDADFGHWSKEETQAWSRNYLSVPVDGIPNFTRIPEVWFWMVRHYRTEQQLMPGVIGVVRDDSRASRIALQSAPLGLATKTYPITDRESITDIGTPLWPTGYDFLRLRVNVHYPVWWKLRKPERLQLEMTRADGSRDLQWVVLPPNTSTDIWFYPWDAPDLAAYFSADPAQWHMNSRPAVTRLRLIATPLDWVSQQPESITVEAADAVKLVMAGTNAVPPSPGK